MFLTNALLLSSGLAVVLAGLVASRFTTHRKLYGLLSIVFPPLGLALSLINISRRIAGAVSEGVARRRAASEAKRQVNADGKETTDKERTQKTKKTQKDNMKQVSVSTAAVDVSPAVSSEPSEVSEKVLDRNVVLYVTRCEGVLSVCYPGDVVMSGAERGDMVKSLQRKLPGLDPDNIFDTDIDGQGEVVASLSVGPSTCEIGQSSDYSCQMLYDIDRGEVAVADKSISDAVCSALKDVSSEISAAFGKEDADMNCASALTLHRVGESCLAVRYGGNTLASCFFASETSFRCSLASDQDKAFNALRAEGINLPGQMSGCLSIEDWLDKAVGLCKGGENMGLVRKNAAGYTASRTPATGKKRTRGRGLTDAG